MQWWRTPYRAFTARMGAAVVLFAYFCIGTAHAVPPKYFMVTDQRIETGDNTIKANLSIGVDNLTGLYEMLKDGASVELLVEATLERPRTLMPNVLIVEKELLSSLQHNPLTREFSLYMPGETKPLLDKNLERLLGATWYKFSIPFGPLDLLAANERDTEYRVTIVCKLQHAKPPPWLGRGFMLWSKNILDPEKIVMEFRY